MQEILDDNQLVRRPTTAIVHLEALRHNVSVVRSMVGPEREIMAIVKANAYGHGLVRTAQAFLAFGVDRLGVAFLEEGIALRRAGIEAPILVLGGIIGNQVVHFLEHDLEITAASPFKLEQIEEVSRRVGRRARVHLKFDTGMERLGVHWDSAEKLLEAAARVRHVEVVGLFSHLSESENRDPTRTREQEDRFRYVLALTRRYDLPVLRTHLSNSGGLLYHPETWFDMVRVGLVLYGIGPRGPDPRLRPALSLVTRVVYFKVVRTGSRVSYDGTWEARKDTRVVTLPVGYGDGYSRALSNRAEVLVRGRRCPVVGRVTMDATMVDIGPEGTAYNGDEVMLIGEQAGPDDHAGRIHVEELAEWSGTIPYEVLTSISARVPRIYI